MAIDITEIFEYLNDNGRSPFNDWFEDLDSVTKRRVLTCLCRLLGGNTSQAKNIGGHICEERIHGGPGIRLYYTRKENMIFLLGGGDKKTQPTDIARAQSRTKSYTDAFKCYQSCVLKWGKSGKNGPAQCGSVPYLRRLAIACPL